MTVDAPPRATAVPGAAVVPALAEVYRAHVGFVWRVLRRLGVEDAALEDVVHDVFLVVHRRLADFEGRSAVTTWLYGIARRVAADYRRRRPLGAGYCPAMRLCRPGQFQQSLQTILWRAAFQNPEN